MQGLQLSPTPPGWFTLARTPGGDRLLHLLPLAALPGRQGGHDLPAPATARCRCGRFRSTGGLALGCVTELFDNLLVRFDLDSPAGAIDLPLGLPVEPFSLDVDRTAATCLAAAGKPNDQRSATAYLPATAAPSGCRSLATAGKRTGSHPTHGRRQRSHQHIQGTTPGKVAPAQRPMVIGTRLNETGCTIWPA